MQKKKKQHNKNNKKKKGIRRVLISSVTTTKKTQRLTYVGLVREGDTVDNVPVQHIELGVGHGINVLQNNFHRVVVAGRVDPSDIHPKQSRTKRFSQQ